MCAPFPASVSRTMSSQPLNVKREYLTDDEMGSLLKWYVHVDFLCTTFAVEGLEKLEEKPQAVFEDLLTELTSRVREIIDIQKRVHA